MTLPRRQFLGLLAGTAATLTAPLTFAAPGARPVRALLFDGFPIFNPRPIYAQAEQFFPGKGEALANAWRARQFDYQWLRIIGRQYVDFWQATQDALVVAAKQLQLELGSAQRDALMQGFLQMPAWPEVPTALRTLREQGVRLAFLSNLTEAMLAANVRAAGLDGLFEQLISTDRIRSYKPDPAAYQLGVDVMRLPREEMVFVPFAGWDNAGAKWYGYRSCWINRAKSPPEELGARADATGYTLDDLVAYVGAQNGAG